MNNRKQNVIRLTERDLHMIIKESIDNVLNESFFDRRLSKENDKFSKTDYTAGSDTFMEAFKKLPWSQFPATKAYALIQIIKNKLKNRPTEDEHGDFIDYDHSASNRLNRGDAEWKQKAQKARAKLNSKLPSDYTASDISGKNYMRGERPQPVYRG